MNSTRLACRFRVLSTDLFEPDPLADLNLTRSARASACFEVFRRGNDPEFCEAPIGDHSQYGLAATTDRFKVPIATAKPTHPR